MYGAKAAKKDNDPGLKSMLKYAIEDEYLAREEYEIAIRTFGGEKPFTSIINSEVSHISWLKELFGKYNHPIPEDQARDYLDIPESLMKALESGVEAEIENIGMYDNFLNNALPNDVRIVFTKLRDASKGHLLVLKKRLEALQG